MMHVFNTDIRQITLPRQFTYPFYYTPHPLCVLAAEEVQNYLHTQTQWAEELQQGKMFGVLIVTDDHQQVGYLAAFSGNLAHSNQHAFFVPPVYDMLQPDGFFKLEEAHISQLNQRISNLEHSNELQTIQMQRTHCMEQAQQSIQAAKEALKEAKTLRDAKRKSATFSTEEEQPLIKESQYQKAELKRLEQQWKTKIATLTQAEEKILKPIEDLKEERKHRSAKLQQQLFEQFRMLNARGEVKELNAIFADTAQRVPPAGAGECAAPKLLQYAYLHHLHPVAMAEFWWGDSPKKELRRHGHYYPACKGKCAPILAHMLQGLDVEPNPLKLQEEQEVNLETVYEDDYLLIVNKPAGILSVPGKNEQAKSVFHYVRQKATDTHSPLMIHRLDMATSGLLIIAKTKDVHKALQAQFKERTIKKKYIALLDGVIHSERGTIELPLSPDFFDRPRQQVDWQKGKKAVTEFVVLERTDTQTRIAFYPHTGRTHQLRIHAAHVEGLNAPIIGDELYGKKNNRLYLHAESIEFVHPITHQTMLIECPADF